MDEEAQAEGLGIEPGAIPWRATVLASARLSARFATLREAVEADGDELEVTDDRRARDRYFRLRVAVPGYGIHLATFDLEEWYDRMRDGWRMTDYQYELRFEPAGSARWAEHWHDDDFHRHCEPAKDPHAEHYPSRPIQLFEARAELLRRYALGPDALSCSGLEQA